jgi:uncharacterized membrane protein
LKNYILSLWDYLRGSYWFLPSLLGCAAFALGFLLPILDTYISTAEIELPPSLHTTKGAARVVISVIASGMFSITGTVFSITVVALSLTSQQFGPRLLRTFMLDKLTQLTLGVFTATGIYSLLVLRIIKDEKDIVTTPHLSVAIAIIMAILSIAILIVFIHHLAMLIQAPQVVRAVADDLDDALERLFPESIDQAEKEGQADIEELRKAADALGDKFHEIKSELNGYIQGIDLERVLNLAERNESTIELLYRPGNFIVDGALLAKVWGAELEDDFAKQINRSLLVGNRRTPRQDIECAIEELVEIAVRSLSPGINDPFTATHCLDWLSSSLSQLASRKLPSRFTQGENAKLRLISPELNFAKVLDTAFSSIRHHCKGDLFVAKHVLRALAQIARNTSTESQRAEVSRQAKLMVDEISEGLTNEYDRELLVAQYNEVEAAINAQAS